MTLAQQETVLIVELFARLVLGLALALLAAAGLLAVGGRVLAVAGVLEKGKRIQPI